MVYEDNTLRFEPASTNGHVESYFLRANHPGAPKAFWLKATIHRPLQGPCVAELWCVVFDGQAHRTWAHKTSVPYSEAEFHAPAGIRIAGAEFVLGKQGRTAGTIGSNSNDSGADDGDCSWDLTLTAAPGRLGERLCMLPTEKLIDAPLPRSKLLTPLPLLRFTGTVEVWGETWEIDDWIGMQGHNWGQEHAWDYAWGQCHFLDSSDAPHCTVEAFSGRLRMAGRTTPIISGMVVRRGDDEYRFDRLLDLWRQEPHIDDLGWSLTMRGKDGTARLQMQADARDMVCLGYHNPDGRVSHCLNSKLAKVTLRMNPNNASGFECSSEFSGALEFLRNDPDPRFQVV